MVIEMPNPSRAWSILSKLAGDSCKHVSFPEDFPGDLAKAFVKEHGIPAYNLAQPLGIAVLEFGGTYHDSNSAPG